MNFMEYSSDVQIDLAGEVLLLGLLGKVLITYPDPNTENKEWFSTILADDLFSEVPFAANQEDVQIGADLLQRWTEASRETSIEDCILKLRVDNTHLFACVGEILAPPWESVYFNKKRLVNQIQLLQVRDWYRKYGLSVNRGNQEPDDHIGYEVLFLAFLAGQAIKENEKGDSEKYAELVMAHHTFFSEHLGLWGALWCDQVIKHASTDFYRGMAYILRGALKEIMLTVK